MLKGKKKEYIVQVILLMIVGILFYYVQTTISGTIINVLTSDVTAITGWSLTQITAPITISSLIGIVISFVLTTMLYKMNPKIFTGIIIFILAITMALMGLAVKSNSYPLYYAAFFAARLFYALPGTALSAFIGNWFVKTRGTVLGIVTIGAPLSSATFLLITSALIPKIGFDGMWYIFAAFIAVVGIITIIFIKKSPTEIGLYADGSEVPPAEDASATEVSTITVREVIKNPDGWLSSIAFALITFTLVCIASFYVVILMLSGIPASVYLPAMTISAVGGIPVSYALGILDDKWGTVPASIVLCGLCLLAPLGLLFAGKGLFFVILSVIGFASMSGGIPNLQPSMNYHVYGKANFLQSYRFTFLPCCILAAFSAAFMASMMEKGMINTALIIMIGFCVVAAIMIAIIGRRPSYDKRMELAGENK